MSYLTPQAEVFAGPLGLLPSGTLPQAAGARPVARMVRAAQTAGRVQAARVRRAAWLAVRGRPAP